MSFHVLQALKCSRLVGTLPFWLCLQRCWPTRSNLVDYARHRGLACCNFWHSQTFGMLIPEIWIQVLTWSLAWLSEPGAFRDKGLNTTPQSFWRTVATLRKFTLLNGKKCISKQENIENIENIENQRKHNKAIESNRVFVCLRHSPTGLGLLLKPSCQAVLL